MSTPVLARRVLVTGGAGFIGANLCRRLAETEPYHTVRVLDDLSAGNPANLDDLPVELVEGSVLDHALVTKLVSESDAVVHLAARGSVPRSLLDPVGTFETNVSGTVNILEAARRATPPHVIFSGSSSVYGANPTLPKHEDLAPRPMSPYAASKLAAEAFVLAYGACYQLPVLAFRFFNVFGPLQAADHTYAAVIPRFVAAALRNEPLTIFGDGMHSRDFTFVGTVTEVLTQALAAGTSLHEPVNLAFGTRVTLLEVVQLLSGILQRPLTVSHTPERPADVRHSQADNSRLQQAFPHVKPTPLADGLRQTVAWMASELAPGS